MSPQPTRKVKNIETGDTWIINEEDFDPARHEPLDGKSKDRTSPTIEEYVGAGYNPNNYPPEGHKEIESPGLKVHKAWKAHVAREAVANSNLPASTPTQPSAPSTPPATPTTPTTPSTPSTPGTPTTPSKT